MTEIDFNFPRTRFADENTPGDQIKHVLSESEELRDAVKEESLSTDAYWERVAEETIDLMHSCQTLLYIIHEDRRGDVRRIMDEVFRGSGGSIGGEG